ncbi:MAG: hypothetical protein ACAH83_05705 [Alphaproteobacteria bacterium]
MAFDWKKKLKDGKAAAGAAFTQAVETGKKIAVKADEKLTALDDKMHEGTVKIVNKVEEKLVPRRKKKEEPKNDGPANG